ncbi:hypothetical protein [Virgibacillus ainsalahensis]
MKFKEIIFTMQFGYVQATYVAIVKRKDVTGVNLLGAMMKA